MFSKPCVQTAAAVFVVLVVAASGVLPGARVAVVVNACNACNFLLTWGASGSGNGKFNGPNGVAVDSSGNVYVVDTGNKRVEKFANTGTYASQLGSFGSGPGEFNGPAGVAVDSAGNVYVVDGSNNRVEKFTSAGVFITQWGCASPSSSFPSCSADSGPGHFNLPRVLP